MKCRDLLSAITRKKTVIPSTLHDTKLRRCLGLIDLIGLGVGSTLGLGVYVVISHITRHDAGPAVVISVIIAGVASLFSGLCYAEFAARLPRAGSAYLYTYVTLGELCGFVVGWNMILENIVGAAAAAKAWSQYFDFLLNNTMERSLTESMQWSNNNIIGAYPDFLAFAFLLLITLAVAIGAKFSSTLNIVLVFLNALVIFCFVCVGFFHVHHENWTDPPGFFAFGFNGVMTGSSTLIFVFVNYEVLTCTSEEVREPSKSVPSAIMFTAIICFAVYFGVSTALTLSYPWNQLVDEVALPSLFRTLNIHGASTIVCVGGLFGLAGSSIVSFYFLARLAYSMGSDRLLFKCFSSVHKTTDTPVLATVTLGLLTAIVALVFRIEILLEILSLGILLAYTSVAICVLCLRYQPGSVGLVLEYEDMDESEYLQCTNFSSDFGPADAKLTNYTSFAENTTTNPTRTAKYDEKTPIMNGYLNYTCETQKQVSFEDSPDLHNIQHNKERPRGSTYKRMDSVLSATSTGSVSGLLRLPSDMGLDPNEYTWRTAGVSILAFTGISMLFCVLTLYGCAIFPMDSWWMVLILFVIGTLLIGLVVLTARQPQNHTKLLFKTPYVPFVPLASILINVYLLSALPKDCWIRFAGWMTIGLSVYFLDGFHHSLERDYDEQEVVLYEITDTGSSSTEHVNNQINHKYPG